MGLNAEAMRELERVCEVEEALLCDKEYINLCCDCVKSFNSLKGLLNDEQKQILFLYEEHIANKENFIIKAALKWGR